MKKQQKQELKTKTADELIKELRDLRSEVSKLVIEMRTGKLNDMTMIKKKKKDIARVMTFLSQKPKENKGVGSSV
jgi:ribosomal protein L29